MRWATLNCFLKNSICRATLCWFLKNSICRAALCCFLRIPSVGQHCVAGEVFVTIRCPSFPSLHKSQVEGDCIGHKHKIPRKLPFSWWNCITQKCMAIFFLWFFCSDIATYVRCRFFPSSLTVSSGGRLYWTQTEEIAITPRIGRSLSCSVRPSRSGYPPANTLSSG